MGKNSLEMKSCKKDSEELVVWLGFFCVFSVFSVAENCSEFSTSLQIFPCVQ